MSFGRFSDNPTDFTEHTLDGNQVTVDNWTTLSAHSGTMSPFGYVASLLFQ